MPELPWISKSTARRKEVELKIRAYIKGRRHRKATYSGYQVRAFALHQLGFGDYSEYLDSELWWGIRANVLDRDRRTCLACGKRATQVHHRAYSLKVLLGLDTGPLVSVCGLCHEWAERCPDGEKRSLERANRRLDGRIQARGEATSHREGRTRQAISA